MSANDFPAIDLVPKKETRAIDFLTQYPNYDGRGVRIGVLDTGISPGAHAVHNFADGRAKLVDVIDCSGSGDVDVSETAKAVWKDQDGQTYWQVKGLTGRTLKLSAAWKIEAFPKGTEETKTDEKTVTVRLGVKRAYELFPEKLRTRVLADRRKIFETEVSGYVATVRKQLADCKLKAGDKPTPEQVKESADLEARLEVLTDSSWSEEDPGPVCDCVVFWDGSDYRAVIDVNETGDLTAATPMTDFKKERQYATFGTLDQMTYCVNIYDDGTVLSIVCDASPHGTHVAGICAADEGERSGVAPGAELVSLKIGDSRLSSMETGTAVTRALIQAVRTGCDVINMSYGEGCKWPNSGRFVELAEDLVWKHNIIYVSSAGNNGPALTTVGAPGGTTSAIIGVAAYVSPPMMKAEYSMPLKDAVDQNGNAIQQRESESFIGSTFTWSSTGPTADGALGVSITAPGAAITSVSHWCLQKSMLMNGTSMSSPNAAGCVALLVSACKAEGIPISSSRIRRALENTARVLPKLSTLQQGFGIIQVDKAFEYLKKFKDVSSDDIYFSVKIENRAESPRGVYLREADECSVRQSYSIAVEPHFRREDVVSDEVQRQKIDFEMSFSVRTDSPWVTVPEKFILMTNGRSFKVDVDPSNLSPGLHTARVWGVDSSRQDRDIIFSLPVTVAKPVPAMPRISLGQLEFEPAEVKRFFLTPPLGSTWMDVNIRDCRAASEGDSTPRLVALHTVQLLPHAAYRDFEKQKYLTLQPTQSSITSIAVEQGVTVELDVARYWSTIGATKVEVSIEFRGVSPTPDNLFMLSGDAGSLVRIRSDLNDELVNPSAKFTKWKTPVRPKADGVVTPLGARDVLPGNSKQIYQLILTYEFSQEDKGSFTPRAPALQGVLYESAFESQLMLAFDGEKKYLGVSDAFVSSITAPKGPVVIRLQIRHDDPKKLEKLKDLCIWIERSLEKEISTSAYTSKEGMMKGDGGFKKRTLRKGASCAVFLANPAYSKLPPSCKPGDVLIGSVNYACGDSSLPGEGRRPGGFPIAYCVGPKPEKSSVEPETSEPKDERTAQEKVDEAIRDLKVSQLGKLTAKEKEDGKFEVLYAQFSVEYPDHLPLLMAKLKYLDSQEKRTDMLQEIVEAASAVVAKIPQDSLAMHFGKKSDSEDPEAVKERKEMKERKGFLTEALARMALAYADMKAADSNDKFEDTLKKLKEWAEIDSSDKYAALVIERETRAGRLGAALKVLNKLIGKEVKDAIKPITKAELYEKRVQIFEQLGYSILVGYDKSTRVISCPKSYRLF